VTLRIRISPGAERAVRSGHPWVYAERVREQNREGTAGDLAVIYDQRDRFLAMGLYDPHSPIRVRILHAGAPERVNPEWWSARMKKAVERRSGLFGPDTTGYRWINGESDGWPGLVLDRYDTTLVLKLYTSIWFERLEEILEVIQEQLPHERVVLRLSRNVQALAARKNLKEGEVIRGAAPAGPVPFLESGILFEADVLKGQKTGFFLDQRENRRCVESLARGRDVLNAFSFSGGFSLYAARGGARSALDLDISAHALEAAKRNFALNRKDAKVAACRHETAQADVFEWLRKEGESGRGRFDLIVLDPPSLARRESEKSGALQAYEKMAGNAIRLLRRGGILAAASCSAHVPATEFFRMIGRRARQSGRDWVELKRTEAPADHPATFPEAHYLKCIYGRVVTIEGRRPGDGSEPTDGFAKAQVRRTGRSPSADRTADRLAYSLPQGT
jgi:23S rRNA (cytosine1962-C5)-methyltransferase